MQNLEYALNMSFIILWNSDGAFFKPNGIPFHSYWPNGTINTVLLWSLRWITIRKSINTNGNTDGIFPSVKSRGILPTEIFPRYIPRELPWEKKIKTKQKKIMTCHFYQRNYRRRSLNPLVNYEHCSSCQLQRESPTEISVGIFQRAPELFTFQLHC